jgi:hypothetical protein
MVILLELFILIAVVVMVIFALGGFRRGGR